MRAAGILRNRHDLVRLDEQELGRGIEEAGDEPRTGDAVDLRPPPGHPRGWRAAQGNVVDAALHQRQLGCAPAVIAVCEGGGRNPVGAQARDNLLAAVVAVGTGDHDQAAAMIIKQRFRNRL